MDRLDIVWTSPIQSGSILSYKKNNSVSKKEEKVNTSITSANTLFVVNFVLFINLQRRVGGPMSIVLQLPWYLRYWN